MDTHTHGQPENRKPLVANCRQRHKNLNISPVFPSTFDHASRK